MSQYNLKTANGKKEIVWNSGRNRGIEEYSKRIGNFSDEIAKRVKKAQKGKIRILDIGCGYGKVLLELKKLHGNNVETYGINLEPKWDLNLIRKFALSEEIFTKKDINKNLPKLWIGESSKGLPYPSNYFDIIISVASMQYVPDKAKLLKECNRVLKKEGICKIQHSFTKKSHPPEYKQLFEIWNEKGKRIDWKEYLKQFKNIQFKATDHKHGQYLILKKTKNFKFKLKLISSLDLHKVNPDWWGTKTIYKLK
jgi:ubiquinone/menaquinone biosynthesis C-methylase UbiE